MARVMKVALATAILYFNSVTLLNNKNKFNSSDTFPCSEIFYDFCFFWQTTHSQLLYMILPGLCLI